MEVFSIGTGEDAANMLEGLWFGLDDVAAGSEEGVAKVTMVRERKNRLLQELTI